MTATAGGRIQPSSADDRWTTAFADYAPLPGIPDELIGANGLPRPAWNRLFGHLSQKDMDRSLAIGRRYIRDLGVSYRVGDEAKERIWPVSGLPLLIEESEWREISAGIMQRVQMFEALLADVYGPAKLVSEGILPAAVVAGSKEFLRPMVGVDPPGGRWLHLYAADIGRGPDGRWWVLNDRAQAPSGAGYALENRLAMSRAHQSAYAHMNVQRLAPFFRAFRDGLAADAGRSQPRICLMTPGPYNQTYSEQSYLARYLGFLLVEGDDLVVHEGKVHVRTIAGLKRADVLWRRVDADFIDPLELNGISRLGVPQLVSAIRDGNVVVANMPGSGFIESRALLSFVPGIARHLMGEELAMPNIATWWCGQKQARTKVLDNIGNMSIAGAFADRIPGFEGRQNLVVADLDPAVAEGIRSAIAARGVDYVGQEVVRLSTTPVYQDDLLVPRPFVLRVYAAATPDGWQIMPGGFCLISDKPDARAVSMGDGVQSADVWVLSEAPVPVESLLPSREDVGIRRILGNLPSRAADNLFWYGRYLERAEAVLRIVRCVCAKSVELDLAAGDAMQPLQRLSGMLVACGAVSLEDPGQLLPRVNIAIGSETNYGSALSNVRMAYGAASVIRERLSVDGWKLLGSLESQLMLKPGDLANEAEAYEAADRALVTLAAISGLAQENVNRVAGWRFLDIGRRAERAINTCRFVRNFAGDETSVDDLDILLDLIDSQITYRSRYLIGVALAPVRDMALLDPYNPRSVNFQIDHLRRHIDTLPTLNDDGIPEQPKRMIDLLSGEIASASAQDIEISTVLAFEQALMRFADAIATRYFLQRPEGLKAKSASGLA